MWQCNGILLTFHYKICTYISLKISKTDHSEVLTLYAFKSLKCLNIDKTFPLETETELKTSQFWTKPLMIEDSIYGSGFGIVKKSGNRLRFSCNCKLCVQIYICGPTFYDKTYFSIYDKEIAKFGKKMFNFQIFSVLQAIQAKLPGQPLSKKASQEN